MAIKEHELSIGIKTLYVTKRDGAIVPFDRMRIKDAVGRAMGASDEVDDIDTFSGMVADSVVNKLWAETHTVESIQDLVEETLILEEYPKTAKHYILYRQERAELRKQARQVPADVRKLVDESKRFFQNDLAEFVFWRTYSRWMESEKRRETWIEAVGRYMDYMIAKLGDKLTTKEYNEIHNYILEMKSMPSMRLLWSAGAACDFDNAAAYNCSYTTVTTIDDFGEILYLLMNGCGVGFSVESHNVQQLPIIARQNQDRQPDRYVIEDSKAGWAKALVLGVKEWYSGRDIIFDYSQLRPAGARLKTMGGRSSGPDPLRGLLDFTKQKILSNQGKRLSNIDVHDIVCRTGECVVSGGVRRSSLISLSDLEDVEMRDAKKGHFYLNNNHRQLANNSVAYNQKPTAIEFMSEWLALAESGTGERGIFNRGSLAQQIPSRRLKTISDSELGMLLVGTNPCVSQWTWVLTSEGPKKVKDLIGRSFTAIVDGEAYMSPGGFFKTGEQMLYKIKTDNGFELEATKNHKVLVASYKTRKTQRNEWKTVGELALGDKIILNNHFDFQWSGLGTAQEGWLLGNLLGDGNIEKRGYANLDYWGDYAENMVEQAVEAGVGAGISLTSTRTNYGFRLHSRPLGELAGRFGMEWDDKHVTDEIEKTSSEFYEGFLSGWFDADGSVQGNLEKGVSVRLASSNVDHLYRAQRMLARLGIISKVYENRRDAGYRDMPNGDGGLEPYWCQANHELIISKDNIIVFEARVGFTDPLKQAKLVHLINAYRRGFNREPFYTKVVSKNEYGVNPVYDCQVDTVNAFDANGLYVHNCGEITLKPKQFCNLTEVVAREDDTLKTLKEKIRIAAILGTYQSMLTDFPFLSKEWKENCEQERLLGVSITGQWDSPESRKVDVQRWAKSIAVDTNKEYAERFGINPSVAVTCVKPSGTVSQLVNASSGIHPRFSDYYVRRVRISATDPLFKMMKDQKYPYNPEVGQGAENAVTYVIDFPVKSPDGAITKDSLSALTQLQYWKQVKEHFVEHNPSCTIYVGSDEWLEVGYWVYQNWDLVGGLAFLPRDDHSYRLAPYQEITRDEFLKLSESFPTIDFAEIMLYEEDDNTEGAKSYGCVGPSCEI